MHMWVAGGLVHVAYFLFVILVACHFIYSIVDDAIILVFTFILVT